MTEPKYHRLAFAQLSFNPAYLDESGVSYLHEPVFPAEDLQGLHKLGGLPEVHDLRSRIATTLIDHMSHKLKAVVEFAVQQGVEVLVLPEYSVPVELLDECRKLSAKIVIVAGSHVVNKPALAEYGRLKVANSPGDRGLGRAACPVFLPNGECYLLQKLNRAKWEGSLVPGEPTVPISVKLRDETIQIEVHICIDAIAESTATKVRRRGATTLTVMPSLTPSVKLFYSKGELLLASGKVTLFANIADFGGSRLFARTERTKGWLVGADGTEPIPPHSEALVVVDADLSNQFDARKSTQEHFPVRSISVEPFIYTQHSESCRQFIDFVTVIASQSIPEAELIENVKRFIAMDYRLFPRLMQEKLTHFLTHVVGQGLADGEAWLRWLTPVVIQTTSSTDALRWDLCGKAIDAINDLTRSDKYPEKTDLLTSTYKHLVNRRRELRDRIESPASKTAAQIATSSEDSLTLPPNLGSFEPPFFDREPI